ncbi:MAG: hypothetical protein VR67_12110 [Peptococcaceae bacterium BRH_c8a]|nr:MAG: hypothetical protein VR67_12110 [Peptococcaceae bacterium BRH_c8a]
MINKENRKYNTLEKIYRMVLEAGARMRNKLPNDEAFVKKHLKKYRQDLIKLFLKRKNNKEERLTELDELARIIHAKSKAAGLTEEQLIGDATKAQAEYLAEKLRERKRKTKNHRTR